LSTLRGEEASVAPTSGNSQRFADRDHAGRALAAALSDYAGQKDLVVFGLPRGGAPVGGQVAAALGAPLDVLVVRKLGLPGQRELAMGAIAGVGDTVEVIRNEQVLTHAAVSSDAFEQVCRDERSELQRRESAYRGGRPMLSMVDRVVILVDDGLATGASMRAAIAAAGRQRPSRLVVAVPIAARLTCERLRTVVDELYCVWIPDRFVSVGQGYRDFTPTSDDEVRRVLAAARSRAGS
jgi:putative phosphoribosyl transferase